MRLETSNAYVKFTSFHLCHMCHDSVRVSQYEVAGTIVTVKATSRMPSFRTSAYSAHLYLLLYDLFQFHPLANTSSELNSAGGILDVA